jgi:hypothetical protein
MKKPDKSEKRCAASERIANEEANIPPTTSAMMKITHTIETVNNLQST